MTGDWSRGTRRGQIVTATRHWFSIDTRALAVFRMALGSIVLVDLLRRSTDLVAFYTDAGVVPRDVLATQAPVFRSISVHALWGSAWAQVVLFVVAGVFALCLLVGYRTRLATLVTFVLLISLHIRNPAVLSGGDSLLRHLLLWGVFLPLGERWSVDAEQNDKCRDSVASFATAGLLLQVVAVYLTNAIFKLRGDIWLNGDAVEQVLSLSRHSTWLGELLLDVPLLLTLADYIWLALLVSSPCMVALTGIWRSVIPGLLAAMHAGMVLLMQLGIFPFVSIAALLPFLPPVVWDTFPSPEGFYRRLSGYVPDTPTVPGLSGVRSGLHSLVSPLAAMLLCGLVLVNAASVGYVDLPEGTPAAIEDKAWNMFAPYPPSDDGWYVMPATLESGQRVDALQRETLRWDRPPDVDTTFPNERWRKLLYQLRGAEHRELQRPLAQYLCWRWNRTHDDEMVSVRIVYVTERTGGDGRVDLGTFACSGR